MDGDGGSGSTFNVDELYHPRVDRDFRHLPALLVGAIRLVWGAAPRQLTQTVLLQAVSSGALAAQVLIARRLLITLLADNSTRDFSSAIPSVILLVAILGVTSVTGIVRVELQRLLSELVGRFAMTQVISAATTADLVRFENPTFHDRLQRAIVNANIRPLQMTTGLLSVGGSLLGTAAVGIALATIEPLFLLFGLVAVIPVTVASLSVGRSLYRFAVEQTPVDRERTYLQMLLVDKEPAKEVRSYELGNYLRGRFDSLYERRISALRRLIRQRMGQGVLGGALTALVSGLALGLLIFFVSDRRVSLAGAGAAAAALILLGSQLQGLAAGLGALYESSLFVRDFNDFVQVVPGMRQFTGVAPVPDTIGRISVENLSFTYPSRNQPNLIDVDLEIKPGEVVALVGENGSGKTTLAKLLGGLYLPQSGRITWDGTDVVAMDISQVRARVAVLFQDFVKYFLSAEDNIGMGRWERLADKEGIVDAAVRSGAAAFLESLPNAYATYLGPQFFGGSDLSGGQWQRVALARAFFRNADLVILDEPTAALDPRAEAELFAAVRRLFAGRSILLISHRFATVRLADHIYVLEQGRVVEHGAHKALMRQGGLYSELFTLQAAAFGLSDSSPRPETRAPRRRSAP